MRFVLRGREPRWLAAAAVGLAIVATLALTAGPIRLAGAAPVSAFERYVISPLTTANGIAEVLLAATPLIFTGLAVAIAFRVGYYNIGAEGQFLAGAMATTAVALALPDLPAGAALPLALIGGALGGVAWAFLPALLRRRAGIDEVVTTLLLNPVAVLLLQGLLNGPWRNPETGFPDSATFGEGYGLPALFGSRVHAGLLIGLVLVVVTAVVLRATPLGVRLRAAGQSPAAAEFSGVRVGLLQWRSALVSGALAGLGGASQVLGVQHQLTGSLAAGYGYTGVVVATLGGLSAFGVLAVALLLGDVQVGAQGASIALQLPSQMGGVLTSVLLLTVVAALSVRHYRLVRRTPRSPQPVRG
ncbi:ABC-type transport permease [Modestobacter italicus]|uniref:ABC-type transport permease n=1 Tax=Modestobacter italicus (strain DSM 44449 / CECT 9708 / BC 501) TaxID=2732864 RepID=I4F1N6_MODI5|nr:ABC transporter permease [Modestobacter marinus]CCH89549.1 ABC-type transport permease [Modestobacter marinus]